MNPETSLEAIASRSETPGVISIPPAYYGEEPLDQNSLKEYWHTLMKRRWTIISIVLVVLVTVTIGTLKQRPVYQAKVVMQIDRENQNILSFKDFAGLEGGEDSYLETTYRNLQGRNLVREVVRKLQLDQHLEFNPPPTTLPFFSNDQPEVKSSATVDELADPHLHQVVEKFLSQLTISPIRRSRLVEIAFESYDPALAARIINTLAASYIADNLQVKFDATQIASELISQQLVGLKAKLEKSEEDLQRYAKENQILQVDEKQNISSQKLKQFQEEYVKAEAELFQRQSVYSQQVNNGDLSSVTGMMDNKLYQDLSTRLADLRREYSDLSTTFTPEYPKLKRLKSQIDELERSQQKERSLLARKITDDYRAAESRVKLLKEAVAVQGKEFNDIAEKSIQYNILKREVDTNRQIYEGLLQRLKEAGVSAGMKASNIRVVDQAEVPVKPIRPRVLLNLALALTLGLGLGIGMALFQESLDNTLKSSEDVQRFLHLPSLGIIPAADSARKTGKGYGYGVGLRKAAVVSGPGIGQLHPELIGANGNWALLEAYRSLRASILLSTSDRALRTMLVTSAQPGEGKTTTAVNLGVILAQLGSRVLIVDADMRKPRVAELLQVPKPPAGQGLSTCLTGQFSLDECAMPTAIPNVFILPCGPIPPNPPELLSSKAMRQLLVDAREKFDFVLLDSPPILAVSDGRILASVTDGVILVAHGGKTPRELVNGAKVHLFQANAHVVGVALNQVDLSATGYGRYSGAYYKAYGENTATPDNQKPQQSA